MTTQELTLASGSLVRNIKRRVGSTVPHAVLNETMRAAISELLAPHTAMLVREVLPAMQKCEGVRVLGFSGAPWV